MHYAPLCSRLALRIVAEISRIPHRTRPLSFYALLRVYRDLTKTGEPRYIVTLDETRRKSDEEREIRGPKPNLRLYTYIRPYAYLYKPYVPSSILLFHPLADFCLSFFHQPAREAALTFAHARTIPFSSGQLTKQPSRDIVASFSTNRRGRSVISRAIQSSSEERRWRRW